LVDLEHEIYLAIKGFCRNGNCAEMAAHSAIKLVEEKITSIKSTNTKLPTIANLTVYEFNSCDCDCDICERNGGGGDGRYVKIEEAMEDSLNSLQHIRVEIATLATELQDFNNSLISRYGRVTEIIEKMRQLLVV
jgi:hypothetical protein